MTWLEFKVFGKHKLRNLRFDLTFLCSMPSMLLFLLFLSLYTHTHTRFTHKLTNKHRLSFSHTLTDTLTHASLLKFIGAFHKRFFFLWGSYRRNTALPSLLSLSHYCAFKLSLTHALSKYIHTHTHTHCACTHKRASRSNGGCMYESLLSTALNDPCMVVPNVRRRQKDSCAWVSVCAWGWVCAWGCVGVVSVGGFVLEREWERTTKEGFLFYRLSPPFRFFFFQNRTTVSCSRVELSRVVCRSKASQTQEPTFVGLGFLKKANLKWRRPPDSFNWN